MQNSYERVFGTRDLNSYPPVAASALKKVLDHTLNKSNGCKVLDLSWGEYVAIKNHTGIDLRCALNKSYNVKAFNADNEQRYIRLSYKNYEVRLYFDEQLKIKPKNTGSGYRFKSELPQSNVYGEILVTAKALERIPRLILSDLVFVDTETTGLFNADHVIELGIVNASEAVLFDSLLKPKRKREINPMAMKAHGITESSLHGKPRLLDVQKEVMACLQDKYVVFYNAQFDVGKMLKSSDGHIFDSCAGVICLMKVYKDYNKKSKNTSLIKACDDYGVNYNDLPNHRAVGDAIKTARLCRVLLEDLMQARTYIENADLI